MKNDKKWEYEDNFYLTCENSRLGKLFNQFEVYKKILHIPGDVLEFGVHNGNSLIRFLTFRDLLENQNSRKIFGFDTFGEFPNNLSMEDDKIFVNKFKKLCGNGISKKKLEYHLDEKGFTNYELIEGDILDTLPKFINSNEAKRFSLIHIDVDVYEPTKIILEYLWDKLVENGILLLDDYGTVYGETKAVEEFFKNKNITINNLQFNNTPTYIIKKII